MTTQLTLNAIATDVVGHYANAAKGLATAYSTAAQRRAGKVVGESVARIAQRHERAIEFVSGQALKGLETFAQRTDWAKDMFVVAAVRRINLPAAQLSLEIARRIDEAASTLVARAEGIEHGVTKAVARKQPAKRVRRAA